MREELLPLLETAGVEVERSFVPFPVHIQPHRTTGASIQPQVAHFTPVFVRPTWLAVVLPGDALGSSALLLEPNSSVIYFASCEK